MDKKKLLEEKNRLESDYDKICKKLDAVKEEYDANINDEEIGNRCFKKYAEYGKELDEIYKQFIRILEELIKES